MRSPEHVKKVRSWGEEYIDDERIMPHAWNFVCGWQECPAKENGTKTDIEKRIVGVDTSGKTPPKYSDEHGESGTPMIYPPVYILRCPTCTRRSWAHSGEDVGKVSAEAEQFQKSKKK